MRGRKSMLRWELTSWDSRAGWKEHLEYTLRDSFIQPIKLTKQKDGTWQNSPLPDGKSTVFSGDTRKQVQRAVEDELISILRPRLNLLWERLRDKNG